MRVFIIHLFLGELKVQFVGIFMRFMKLIQAVSFTECISINKNKYNSNNLLLLKLTYSWEWKYAVVKHLTYTKAIQYNANVALTRTHMCTRMYAHMHVTRYICM